jgi:voltage-gated potassium channel
VLLGVGTAFYALLDPGEHPVLDALYMTVITLTTVGYGEIVPLEDHPGGRVFTMVLLLFGMGVLVYFASTVTALLVEGELRQVFWRKRMLKKIAELKEHYIVVGDRTVAGHVIDELRRVRRDVVAVVPEGSAPPPLSDAADLLVVEGDPADEDTLKSAGILRAAGVVAAMESDRETILVTLAARQTNPFLRIVAMLSDERNEQKLRRAGADAVVRPFLTGGLRMASEMIRPSVVTFLDQMLRDRDRNLRIDEIEVGDASAAIGKSIGELAISDEPGVLLLALVEPDGTTYRFKPDPAQKVGTGAVLIVMGGPDDLAALRRRYGGHAYKLADTAERSARA